MSVPAKRNFDFDTDMAGFSERQLTACDALDSGTTKHLLYGGAVGGGKSYFLRWLCVRRLMELATMGHKHVTVMLACEDYPALKDRQLQKIAREFPPWMGKMHQDHKEYGKSYILHKRFGSGVICFRNLDDPSKYASSEFAMICVDELTKNDYELFTFLRMRLRWPGLPDMDCWFVGATNPGGVGHAWCKQLWMDKAFPIEFQDPVDYRSTFVYVPSKADDNPHLDASYYSILGTLPQAIRKAFKDGDWDIFLGQAFTYNKRYHVIPDGPIPELTTLYMTFDWGFGAPFSIGWWYVDEENRIIRFDEWYGWNGQPNQGLRLTDPQIAEGIIEMEKKNGVYGRAITRYAGPDCFSKKPDYKGGGQGPSTSEVFSKSDIFLTPGDPDRKLKIRAFRERMLIPEGGGKPMLQVMKRCKQFIRTIPNLVLDKNNIEDIDTGKASEDHLYDECCHICMGRPLTAKNVQDSNETQQQEDWRRIHGESLKQGNAVNIEE